MVRKHFLMSLMAAACLASADVAHTPASRNFADGRDIDIGTFSTMESFFNMVGTTVADWAEIDYAQELELELATQDHKHSATNAISGRQNDDQCPADLNFYNRFACQNIPERINWWAVGGPLLVYYGPTLIENWLNSIAAAIQAGRNVRNVYRGSPDGGAPAPGGGVVRVASELGWDDVDNVHFKISNSTVSNVSGGAAVLNEYSYNTHTHEVHYEKTIASFSSDSAAVMEADHPVETTGKAFARAPTDFYSILLTTTRRNNFGVSQPGCIAARLKQLIDEASQNHRGTCTLVDDLDARWALAVGVHISDQRDHAGAPRECC